MRHDISEFQTLFNAKIRERGLNLRKVSELTGINLKHLEYLSAANYDNLPPAPYFRGYLLKLSGILGFDADEWWESFKASGVIKSSGTEDELPKNRFARRPYGRIILISGVILVFALYVGLRFTKIIGAPRLTITYPGESPTDLNVQNITVRGTVENGDKVLVGGSEAAINSEGAWEKQILLEPGLNAIEIRAKKLLGREVTAIRFIVYRPQVSTTTEILPSAP